MALSRKDVDAYLARAPREVRGAYIRGELDDAALERLAGQERAAADAARKRAEAARRKEQEPSHARRVAGSLADKAVASVERGAASRYQRSLDAEVLRKREESDPWYKRDVFDLVGLGPDERAQIDAKLLSAITGRSGDTELESREDLIRSSEQREQSAARVLQDTGRGRGVLETAQDVAGSPTSVLSVIGGPVAAVGIEEAKQQAYLQARRNGLDPTAAERYAADMAAPEMISFIPAGKILQRVPGVNRLLTANPLTAGAKARIAGGVARTAVGEGLEESATEVGQAGVQSLYAANAEDRATREYAERERPKTAEELADRSWRAFKAGALGGSAVSSPMEAMQVMSQAGRAAADAAAANERTRTELTLGQRRRQERREATQNSPTGAQGDLFGGGGIAPEAQATPSWQERADQVQAEVRDEVAGMFAPAQPDMFGTPDNLTAPANRNRVNLRDGDSYVNPETGERGSVLVDSKTGEASKLLESQRKAAEKNRLKAYNNARNRNRESAVKEAMGLPEDQRTRFVAERLANWEKANPKDQFQLPTPTQQRGRRRNAAAPVVAPAPAAPAAPITAPAQQAGEADAPARSLDDIRNLVADAPLARNSNPTTNLTSADVLNAVGSRLPSKQQSQINKMITDGNLVIVDDVSELPQGSPADSVGLYDGKRTYIVANRVDPNNIVGSLLDTAVHEVKHAADVGGGEKLRATMGNFIGREANNRINTKIEAAAQRGDATAQAAVKAAKAGSTPDTYALELPAYFINAQRDARASKGIVGRITGDIVSAVRTSYKSLKGDLDIELNDVNYLADKLLQEAAISGERMEGKISNPLPMIVSGGKTADRALSEGRTWLSADGRRKYEVSDNNSRVTLPERIDFSEVYPAGQVLKHDAVYEEFPELANVPVQFTNDPTSQYGGFYRQPDGIYPLGLININLADNNGPANNFNSFTHRNMIHELQHAAQFVSDTTGGASPEDFLSPEGRRLRQEITDTEAAVEFGRQMRMDRSEFADLTDRLGELQDQYDAEWQKALSGYTKVLGEQEAYSTVERLPLTDAERQDDTTTREQNIIKRDGGTFTPRGKRLAASATQTRLSNDQQNYIGRGEFKVALQRWMRERGLPAERTPQMMLHDGQLISTDGDPETAQRFLDTLEGTPVDGIKVEQLPPFNYEPVLARTAIQRMRSPDNRVIKILKKSFAAFGAIGRELGTIKEMSDGNAALMSHRAMNLFTQINRGTENLAKIFVTQRKYKTQDEAVKAVQEMIQGKMDQMAAEPSPEARQRMLASFVRQYPQLEPLQRAMDEVNMLSKIIVKQMLDTNPDPSNEDIRLMNTIIDNTYRYTTRMYAAFQGEAGRRHSEQMMKSYRKALEATGRVPEKHRENFNIVKNAVKYLIDNDLTIPDRDTLETSSMEKLQMLHDTWITGSSSRVREQAHITARNQGMTIAEAKQYEREVLINNLVDRADSVTEKQMVLKAEDAIKSMLNLSDNNSSVASFYRNFAQDRSILENRSKLPEELRELFGEIKDPATRFAVTIAKQGELAARTRMLLEIRDKGNGKWVIPAADVGVVDGSERFTETLGGESYGPLNGWRTTPELKAAIGDSLEMFSTIGDALAQGFQNSAPFVQALVRGGTNNLMKLASLQKLMSVVVSFYNMGTNFLGSPIVLLANGIYNPKHVKGGADVAARVIWDAATAGGAKLTPQFEDAIRYGILDSAQVQDIRRTPQEFVRNLISTEGKTIGQARRAARRVAKTGVETFAMSDAWVKIVAFQERTDMLTKFYKAEGVTKTAEEIKREAADQIKDTNITYARTGALIRAFERGGLTTFMPYFVSVPRAITYNMIQGIRDIVRSTTAKSPQGRTMMAMAGARRAAGSVAATYGVTMMMKTIAAAVNAESGEDEEALERAKKLMMPDARFADSFYLGKDEKGVPMFARFSRIDPFGPATDFMRIAMDEETSPQDKSRYMLEMLRDMIITNRVLITAGKAAVDIVDKDEAKNRKTRIERVAPQTAIVVKELLDYLPLVDGQEPESILEFIDSFTPGMVNALDPRNVSVAEGQGSQEGAEFLSTLISLAGGRLDRADAGLAAYGAGDELKRARNKGRGRQAEGLAAGLDSSVMLDNFMEDALHEYHAMRDVQEVYDGMVNGLGMSPRQAAEVLKEDGKLTSNDIAALRRGALDLEAEAWARRYSGILSKKSQRERQAAGSEELTDEQKTQIKAYLKKLEAMGYNVKE